MQRLFRAGTRRWPGVLLVILVCLASPLPAWWLIASLPLAHPAALLMLASHEWERLPALAGAATKYPNAQILLTVPVDPTPESCFRCDRRVAWLKAFGIDSRRVTEVVISENGTWGEAVTARAVAGQRDGFDSLLVITSPYHTRRSLYAFRYHFADTDIEIGVQPATDASPAAPTRWLLSEYDRDYVAYEWAALVYYVARMVGSLFADRNAEP